MSLLEVHLEKPAYKRVNTETSGSVDETTPSRTDTDASEAASAEERSTRRSMRSVVLVALLLIVAGIVVAVRRRS